jgi:uncharacterized protein with NAD-binding domain and iron-sulfur cluster
MGALSAAWELSAPGWRSRFESITLYQRGAQLGGKAASSRGIYGRIEEHGLHVWMGYYDNAFRLVQECYGELDRAVTDPSCPIRNWRDGFSPCGRIGVSEPNVPGSYGWVADLKQNDRTPGVDAQPRFADDLVRRLLDGAGDALRSILGGIPSRELVLSASPAPPRARSPADQSFAELEQLYRNLESGNVAAISVALGQLALLPGGELAAVLLPTVRAVREFVDSRLARDRRAQRAAQVLELLLVMILGAATDGLIEHPEQSRRIDDTSMTDWLARHGARRDSLASPLVRGMHDLVFGYEDGDGGRPVFPAGLGLQLTTRLLLDYKGAIFWKLRGGMGDVVIAPLYQALTRRGVRFRFFHNVDHLELSTDRSSIDRIRLTVQGQPPDEDRYDPLVRVHGLPCFPCDPDRRQMPDSWARSGPKLESGSDDGRGTRRVFLERGRDFDWVILGISVGALPGLASELIAANQSWRAMTSALPTVATQAFQVWLNEDERELGSPHPDAVIAGGDKPFDTYASMSHLVPAEAWPESCRPKAIGYFCSVLPGLPAVPPTRSETRRMRHDVRRQAIDYLERQSATHWPNAHGLSGFRWSLLSTPHAVEGSKRFGSQYWTCNVDPSDRYVQATPASDRFRLAPDHSGFTNLVLAGDWTDTGLNAGCIEAAVLSGIRAANAIKGEARGHRGLGGWEQLSDEVGRAASRP